jgi:hypothetical protein
MSTPFNDVLTTTSSPGSSTNATLSALDAAFGGFPVEFALYMFVLGCLLLYQVFFNGRVMACTLVVAVEAQLWR